MTQRVKQFAIIDEQINALTSRWLALDHIAAEQWFRNIDYYRLSGYWYPYREIDGPRSTGSLKTGGPSRSSIHTSDTAVPCRFRAPATWPKPAVHTGLTPIILRTTLWALNARYIDSKKPPARMLHCVTREPSARRKKTVLVRHRMTAENTGNFVLSRSGRWYQKPALTNLLGLVNAGFVWWALPGSNR